MMLKNLTKIKRALRLFQNLLLQKLTSIVNIISNAGLAVVANVAIATDPALLAAPRSFVLKCSLLYARVDVRFTCPRQTLRNGAFCFAHAIQKLHWL